MTRNIYHLKSRTLYDERTGEPYTIWFASCTFPTGKYFCAQNKDKIMAVAELRRQMRELAHSAELALKYLGKEWS